MPSNYEPCGIGQLIAMRYGTIPVVRETGGLKDTVTQFSNKTGEGTGYLFQNYNAHEMMYAVKRAIRECSTLEIWQKIVRNAMQADFSWKKSAGEYKALYEKLLAK